jgi:uncharacterized protein (TIGR02246 family)
MLQRLHGGAEMTDSHEQTASDIAGKLQRAWNDHDAVGFAGAFAEDADFIHILGGHGHGRAAIAQAHRALFDSIYRESRVRFALADVRSLAPDAFIALLVQHLVFGSDGNVQEMTCRPTLIVVRRGQDWSVVLMQNTRTVEAAPAGLSDHPFAPARAMETAR